MPKTPKPSQDQPDNAASQEAKLLWALDGLIESNGPVMITSWVAIVEYMDQHGHSELVPLCSDMPQWRMTGMIDTGREMLIEEYAYYDDDD